jgi:predicted secreted hydrolase
MAAKERTVKPQDEGEHYKDLLVNREWWYYTAIFSKDSELAGWTLTVSFNHMSRTDLFMTKPDLLFVVLTGPDGDRYGGFIEKERPLLGNYAFLKDPVLQAISSDRGFKISFEDSYVKGKWPNWHLHIDVDNIGAGGHDLLIDLQFFAPSSPIWIHNNRPIDGSNAKIASYAFIGCDVSGSVEIDGFNFDVKGIGHHEHTWATGGILMKTLIRGWDWAHITMENGWNIYYSNYYLVVPQIKSTKDSKMNRLGIVIVTNDQGKKITLLEDIDIKIERSDDVTFLMKMPIETQVTASPSLTQLILSGYNIKLDLTLTAENTFDYTWKKLSPVGMRIGDTTTSGVISWSDDYGDHEVQLDGVGTIWNMRH